jgi:hypothetical protein
MRSTGAARADSPAGPAPPRGPRALPHDHPHWCLVEEAGVPMHRLPFDVAATRPVAEEVYVWSVHEGSYPHAQPPHSELEAAIRDVRRLIEARRPADLGAGAEEVDLSVLLAADLLDDVQSSYFVESSRLINEALAAARELLVIANALPEPRAPERRRFSRTQASSEPDTAPSAEPTPTAS